MPLSLLETLNTMTHDATTLHALLDQSLLYPPEYGGQLSSHLPMALTALDGLGADGARLQAFLDHYASRFGAGPTAQQAAPATAAALVATSPDLDWPALRGRFDAFDTLRAHFLRALARDGRDAVLRAALPLLLTGAGAAAFHGAIRTGHAVDSGHAGELAAALAYWAARWSPLPPPSGVAVASADIDGVADWLDAVDDHRARDRGPDGAAWRPAGRMISDRMLASTASAAYREAAGRLRTTDRQPTDLLRDLARAAAARYARSGNFTVLHMTTGARAALVLAPWLPADDAALQPLWHAVAAASLASNLALTPTEPDAPAGTVSPSGWTGVRAQAIVSDDDHVIKLVHAAAMLHAADPDPVWLQAAARAVAG
jgi:hypothetical protein